MTRNPISYENNIFLKAFFHLFQRCVLMLVKFNIMASKQVSDRAI